MEATLVIGLGFGDEGKGTIVDYLTRVKKATTVIKFSGGPQNAHHVVLPDGTTHCFSQFGSGTLAGANTYISKYCYVDPIALLNEADHLQELGIQWWERLWIDAECLLVTPYHIAANVVKEYYRDKKHGSCGRGINETVQYSIDYHNDAPRVSDMFDYERIQEKLRELQFRKIKEILKYGIDYNNIPEDIKYQVTSLLDKSSVYKYIDSLRNFEDCVARNTELSIILSSESVIFEGSQGVLLDQNYEAYFPHLTRSTTTFQNALDILAGARYNGSVEKVAVTRAYMTRHGYGPFKSEVNLDKKLDIHNEKGTWQGDFRYGILDLQLLEQSKHYCGGFDYVALTCVDQIEDFYGGVVTEEDIVRNLKRYLAPVGIISRGMTWEDKEWVINEREEKIA